MEAVDLRRSFLHKDEKLTADKIQELKQEDSYYMDLAYKVEDQKREEEEQLREELEYNVAQVNHSSEDVRYNNSTPTNQR